MFLFHAKILETVNTLLACCCLSEVPSRLIRCVITIIFEYKYEPKKFLLFRCLRWRAQPNFTMCERLNCSRVIVVMFYAHDKWDKSWGEFSINYNEIYYLRTGGGESSTWPLDSWASLTAKSWSRRSCSMSSRYRLSSIASTSSWSLDNNSILD